MKNALLAHIMTHDFTHDFTHDTRLLTHDTRHKGHSAETTRAKPTWYFAGSYLRFSACYVDENNTIRFSEKFPIDTYNKMSTL